MNKELKALARIARHQGWTIEHAGSRHLIWRPPNGRPFVTTSLTPSHRSALKAIRADLQRSGLKLDNTNHHHRKAIAA